MFGFGKKKDENVIEEPEFSADNKKTIEDSLSALR